MMRGAGLGDRATYYAARDRVREAWVWGNPTATVRKPDSELREVWANSWGSVALSGR